MYRKLIIGCGQLVLVLLLSPWVSGGVIPPQRLVTWTPGVTVGVPGGIPATRWTTNDVTKAPYFADPTGGSNAATQIQAAINAAPSNSVVYLPPGTYRIDNGITLSKYITLAGAGMNSTTLTFNNNANIYYGTFNNSFNDPSSSPIITGGLLKGSTNLITASTSNFTLGRMLQIGEFNHTNLNNQSDEIIVRGVGASTAGAGWLRKQKTFLVGMTATNLYIWPPLYTDYTNTTARSSTDGYPNSIGVGVESMTLNASNSTATAVLYFEEVMNSWITGVKVRWANNYSIQISDCFQCEIRGCYLDALNHAGSNGAGLLFGSSSGVLVENNIILQSFPSVEVNNGCSGNVFGYNYFLNTNGLLTIDSNHGAHNEFNLYEGNIANNFMSDSYFGSASQDTVYRNWLTGDATGYTNEIGWCVALKRWTRDYNIVGNVFGDPAYPIPHALTPSFGEPNMGNSIFSGYAPTWADWTNNPGAGGFQEIDTNVANTTLEIGNYSYFSNAIPPNESLGTNVLAISLYLTNNAAPLWWTPGTTWPPFDPTISNPQLSPSSIPAGYTFTHGSPQGIGNPPSTPTNFTISPPHSN